VFKVIAMMKRKPGITPEEFARYWSEEHAPLGFEVLPEEIEIFGYVQNYTVRTEGDQEPEFDGLVEFCFEDEKTFQRWFVWFLGEGGQPLRDDEKNFMDSSSVKLMIVKEKVLIPRRESAA
jgi:uncharacterized protein (TIGR02118 family)